MTLRKLPEAKVFARPVNYQWDAPSDVLAKWVETPQAAAEDADNTISMFDVIGEDYWSGGGVTAKRIAAALRTIGNRDVVVKLNSPGGDMFEGIAIYNLLQAHPAKVTVDVIGWAASAASVIAMAGDEIRMGVGSFMMVHKAWGMVIGNEHDLLGAAANFKEFDAALADIYEARTGLKRAEITRLMDGEGKNDGTFMSASESVSKGFADAVFDGGSVDAAASNSAEGRQIRARREVEAALAKQNYSRDRRAKMLADAGINTMAQRDASHQHATRDAGTHEVAARQLIDLFKI